MRITINQALTSALSHLLRPLVRILLRHGVPFRTFAEIAKQAYVTVAMEEFRLARKRQTVSRISILTGLSRKEVQRVLRHPPLHDEEATVRYNRAARVITGWLRDPEFLDPKGRPIPLSWQGGEGSFGRLAKQHSGDVPARALLDELLRVGAVERIQDGRFRLLSRGYVPQLSEVDKLGILGADVADLIGTIDHNLLVGPKAPRFQRKVMYDNLPAEAVERFRVLAGRRAQMLLEALDRWLARQDRDVNPSVRGTGRVWTGVGIYYFEESSSGDTPRGNA